jgi:hypothetical protein
VDDTATDETSNSHPTKMLKFFTVFFREFASGIVVLPIIWVLGRLLHIESGKVEFVAAPVILAWFAVRGWETEEAIWPFRLTLSFIRNFVLATFVLVGLPLLLYSVVYGCILLLKFHDPHYLRLLAFVVGSIVSSALVWIGRETGIQFAVSILGLSHATVTEKARFGFYWLASIAVLAFAVWPRQPTFETLCDYARQAGRDIDSANTGSLERMKYSSCSVRSLGDGYVVTIGAVSGDNGGIGKITHFSATLSRNGNVNNIQLLGSDLRSESTGSSPMP